MIVVAIIGILAAIGMPQYQNYVARTQVAEGLSLASGIKTAMSLYRNTNGDFPPSTMSVEDRHNALGVPAPTEFRSKLVRKIEVKTNGALKVRFFKEDAGVNTLIADKAFWLLPTDNRGYISWRCACAYDSNHTCPGGGATDDMQIAEKYLPSSCL